MYRLNVRFSAKQRVALNKMAAELGTTKGDVLRKALALLAVAIREHNDNNQLGVINDNHVVKEITGIFCA